MSERSLLLMIVNWMANAVMFGAIAFMFGVYAFGLVSFIGLPMGGMVIGSIAGAIFIRILVRRINRDPVNPPPEAPADLPDSP